MLRRKCLRQPGGKGTAERSLHQGSGYIAHQTGRDCKNRRSIWEMPCNDTERCHSWQRNSQSRSKVLPKLINNPTCLWVTWFQCLDHHEYGKIGNHCHCCCRLFPNCSTCVIINSAGPASGSRGSHRPCSSQKRGCIGESVRTGAAQDSQ
jgi:hypothetical protein